MRRDFAEAEPSRQACVPNNCLNRATQAPVPAIFPTSSPTLSFAEAGSESRAPLIAGNYSFPVEAFSGTVNSAAGIKNKHECTTHDLAYGSHLHHHQPSALYSR